MIKAYMSVITRSDIDIDTMMSITQRMTIPSGIIWTFGYTDENQATENCIEQARNLEAEFFLTTPDAGDVILFVDSDIVFLPEAANHIVHKCIETKSIVGGLYPTCMQNQVSLTSRMFPNTPIETGTDKLVEAEAVAGGFMAIHRDVLTALLDVSPHHYSLGSKPFHRWFESGTLTSETGSNIFITEDWSLSYKARSKGIKSYIDMFPTLGHVGKYIYTMNDVPGATPLIGTTTSPEEST